MIRFYSKFSYAGKYKRFLRTPPIKKGICFGVCVTWLTRCMEANISNMDIDKYLQMKVGDDFFWSSFSMQRWAWTISNSPEVVSDFLNRMEEKNKKRQQAGLRYKIDFSAHEGDEYKEKIAEFFRNETNLGDIGIIFGLKNPKRPAGHAIAALKVGNERYLMDPNHGVLDVTYCFSSSEAFDYINSLYAEDVESYNSGERHLHHKWEYKAVYMVPKFIS